MAEEGGKAKAAGRIWRLILLFLYTLACFCAGEGTVALAQEEYPDYLEAENASIDADGLIHASSGATLYISSLVKGSSVTISADEVVWNQDTGEAELRDGVRISLDAYDFAVTCDYCHYDPVMERLQVSGLELAVPLTPLLGEALPDIDQPAARFGGHLLGKNIRTLYLVAGHARFELSARRREMVITDARLSHHPDPDPDLFLHVDKVRVNTATNRVTFEGISLKASGLQLIAWPRYTHPITREPQVVTLDFPRLQFSRDVGVVWKQGLHANLGLVNGDALLDYSPDYGLRPSVFAYIEPVGGTQLGVEIGTRSVVDIDRQEIERRDEYNFKLKQHFEVTNEWLSGLELTAEYGRVYASWLPEADGTTREADDTRLLASATLDLPPLPLGNNWYIVSRGEITAIEYEDAAEDYDVIGGSVGLVRHRQDFNHFVQYTLRNVSGRPVFPFDKVREEELSFATSFRLHPQWRHVVRGVYDVDAEEFDLLQVSALKRLRTYELGLYWDFARESAGLEVALLLP